PFVGYGYGLGLALAKQIVEGLGGKLRYDARSGQGSLFTIGLPIADPYGYEVTPPPPARAPEAVGRVLVVDDEPMIGRAVKRMLAPDYEVVVATTGAEGLERLTANPSWALVLLDLMMPGMGGVEVYEEIERQLPALVSKVVVVTGGIYTNQAHQFLERTSCATLRKPFDADDLHRAIGGHAEMGPRQP
ncbi:MAG: response regulator, partial [Myxococcota bacterium]